MGVCPSPRREDPPPPSRACGVCSSFNPLLPPQAAGFALQGGPSPAPPTPLCALRRQHPSCLTGVKNGQGEQGRTHPPSQQLPHTGMGEAPKGWQSIGSSRTSAPACQHLPCPPDSCWLQGARAAVLIPSVPGRATRASPRLSPLPAKPLNGSAGTKDSATQCASPAPTPVPLARPGGPLGGGGALAKVHL